MTTLVADLRAQLSSALAGTRRPTLSRAALASPPVVLALMGVAFVAVSAWWLAVETRPPTGDAARHLEYAAQYSRHLADWNLLGPFETYNVYPPLVHVVGALALVIADGDRVLGPTLAMNLAFVPLLVVGVYGAGKAAFGPRAGVLAVVFALAAPMLIAQFHMFMLDGPLTALAALSVWLILASDRFSRRGYVIAAGVAMGLGMLTKNVFPVFVAGPLIVTFLRGGWRNWLNIVLMAVPTAAIGLTWNLVHSAQISSTTEAVTTNTTPDVWYDTVLYPERWSFENFTWYAWNLVNNQLYMPLAAFFAVGLVLAVRRLVKERRDEHHVLELLAGGVISYFMISLLILDDPRYTLPALVYIAVIAVGWIAQASRRVQVAATAVLVALLVVNTTMQNFDVGGRAEVELPGAPGSPIRERAFTFFAKDGFVVGPPDRDARVGELFEAAREDGVRRLVLGGNVDNLFFHVPGIEVLRIQTGLEWGADPGRLGADDLYVERRLSAHETPAPCTVMQDGSGLYVWRGDETLQSFNNYPRYCPLDER